ncbi:MAG: hypothetical protein LBM97_01680 [Candidatus Nomurabacteria bacterium]|jgi:hypothetical protein|nr:hypothetical protein [Candidatus Nomurabacteria bacterium]
MKKSDVAILILASVGSVLVAYFVGNALFGKVENETESVPTFTVIEPTLTEPRVDIFNKTAINPTVEIEVGKEDNSEDTTEETAPAQDNEE